MKKELKKLLKKPPPKDFKYSDLVKIFRSFGFIEKKGNGSRRKFENEKGEKFNMHEPHPSTILKAYQIREAIQFLKEKGHV